MTSSPSERFDVVILGGGPAGHACAVEASACGRSVAVIEASELGGTCLNRGCIPTKLFLGATDCVHELAAQAKMRVASGSIAIDLPALQDRKAKMLAGNRQAIEKDLSARGITLLRGRGTVVAPGMVDVVTAEGTVRVEYGDLVVATGSRPTAFPGMTPDGDRVLDSDGILDLSDVPQSMVIVGGGVIGLELGRFFARLGTSITVVEALDRLAPWEDPEVSKTIAQLCKREKWTIHTGKRVASLVSDGGRARLVLESGDEILAEVALVATGRGPVTEGLGLENAGCRLDRRGFVTVDERLRAADHVWAVGDVNGKAMLAHAASHQGAYVARCISGCDTGNYTPGPMPWCIYGAPETMRVGEMPAELEARGLHPRVSRAMLAANPIAQAHASVQGFVKIAWVDGRVHGVTAVGHGVAHLITQATIMVRDGWTAEDARRIIWAHPTLDEALRHALTADTTDA
ncbi:dihydrolipoamide dehydrogenase [Desulfobaculum xiamenense]|uniref:Dihydrolipoamide dehydrogenase n=1 Tax=Desulfobaculum xiamenense TaxID=995050 RepID=A0A846QGD3_9BACT|nr:FAD-dependent oxidoreductase [Desulfobaculum xiamenense]NJB67358.1 dihydrolipoamide dehydrogenase [Desulfobaculum xiamenense]